MTLASAEVLPPGETRPHIVDVLIAPIGERAVDVALVLGRDVRKAGVRCEVDTRKASVKAQLRRANTLGARYVVILGDREIDEGVVELPPHAGERLVSMRAVCGSRDSEKPDWSTHRRRCVVAE